MRTADVWFDVVCPWCYLGMRNWRAATAERRVTTRWRSFQLRPGASRTAGRRLVEIMRADWGMTEPEIDRTLTRIRAAGQANGLDLRIESVRPVSTLDAHRLVHLAATEDRAPALLERLFAAYHTDLRDLADHAVLSEVATAAGLAGPAVAEVLAGDRYADRVRADQELAGRAGVTAVPAYRVDGRTRSGALPVVELRALLDGHSPTTARQKPS